MSADASFGILRQFWIFITSQLPSTGGPLDVFRQRYYEKAFTWIRFSFEQLFLPNQTKISDKKTSQLLNLMKVMVLVAHFDRLVAASWIFWESIRELQCWWQSSLIECLFREFGTAKMPPTQHYPRMWLTAATKTYGAGLLDQSALCVWSLESKYVLKPGSFCWL